MSRTLARLSLATGDQLVVQAGRTLAPTPYAQKLSGPVAARTRDTQAVLRPNRLHLALLEQTFTIRAGEGFVDLLSASLVAKITQAAPRVRICFAPKPDKHPQPLREGLIDPEIGVVGTSAPDACRYGTAEQPEASSDGRHGPPLAMDGLSGSKPIDFR
jgi:DNA-binding transcriptional LysR family regulator